MLLLLVVWLFLDAGAVVMIGRLVVVPSRYLMGGYKSGLVCMYVNLV